MPVAKRAHNEPIGLSIDLNNVARGLKIVGRDTNAIVPENAVNISKREGRLRCSGDRSFVTVDDDGPGLGAELRSAGAVYRYRHRKAAFDGSGRSRASGPG